LLLRLPPWQFVTTPRRQSSTELPAPAFKITAIVIESRLPAIVIGTSD